MKFGNYVSVMAEADHVHGQTPLMSSKWTLAVLFMMNPDEKLPVLVDQDEDRAFKWKGRMFFD